MSGSLEPVTPTVWLRQKTLQYEMTYVHCLTRCWSFICNKVPTLLIYGVLGTDVENTHIFCHEWLCLPGLLLWTFKFWLFVTEFLSLMGACSRPELLWVVVPLDSRSEGDEPPPTRQSDSEISAYAIFAAGRYFLVRRKMKHSQCIWYPGGRMRMLWREIFPRSPSSNSTMTPCFPSSDEPPARSRCACPQVQLSVTEQRSPSLWYMQGRWTSNWYNISPLRT